jgi:CheY-like chemotaxis protein
MASTRIHILVVDDLRDAADSIVDLLSIWGYDAVACYSGAAALDSARLHPPTVILLDLAMPRMNGFRFTELLREVPGCRSVSIIAISGYTSLDFRARARNVGIRHYLLKPADPECLKDLLEREIEFAMSPAPFLKIFDGVLPLQTSQPGRRKLGGLNTQNYRLNWQSDGRERDEARSISRCSSGVRPSSEGGNGNAAGTSCS